MAMRKIAGLGLLALTTIAGSGCGDDEGTALGVGMTDGDAAQSPGDKPGDKGTDKDDSDTPAAGMMGSMNGPGADRPMDPEGESETDTSTDGKDGVTDALGATDFMSADPNSSGNSGIGVAESGAAGPVATTPGAAAPAVDDVGGDRADADANTSMEASAQRSVERGDIFRVLGDGRILNFNQYRGIQIIDVSDPSNPVIEGRLRLTGSPVELYVVDDRAILLLNGYQNYYGSRDDVQVERREGGLVATVDLSDRSAPKLIAEHLISGSINTSRLTRQGDKSALYVAAQHYETFAMPVDDVGAASVAVSIPAPGGPTMKLTSYDVSTDKIVKRNEIELGGWVSDVQATSDVMMVASTDYNQTSPRSRVALVDISDPSGAMKLGDEVEVAGIVQNKFNMDISGEILRVVSGGDWSNQVNSVETFNVRDLGNAIPVDSCDFGLNQQLFATLFVEDRAFFVTYLRQDPFHAFSIDAQGQCEEKNEFIVSGWNDFFRAVAGDTRLIGIGKNDENLNNTLAVSLYDITDLSNPEPLLARDEVALDWSSSEASWDDRAFSVLEDAVSVPAADGTIETGLVMLPFEGYENAGGTTTYRSGVQLFTFSDSTLTKRGEMAQASSVRRTFLAEEDVAANLSDEDLTLHDLSDVDAPKQLGQVEVAANYRRVFVYGDQVVRVHEPVGNIYYFEDGTQASRTAAVEVLAKGADPDTAIPVAAIEVPANATLEQVDDLLVSYVTKASIKDNNQVVETAFTVYDLSDPSKPVEVGETTTDVLGQQGGGWFDGMRPAGVPSVAIDCFDCGWGYGPTEALATSSALVFPVQTYHSEYLDSVQVCYESPAFFCADDAMNASSDTMTTGGMSVAAPDGGAADVIIGPVPPPQTCETYYSGQVRCVYDDDNQETCEGTFYKCENNGECEEIAREDLPTRPQRSCYEEENWRNWSSYRFEVLDLSDPSAPAMTKTIEMPKEHEGTSAEVFGDTLYFNFGEPIDVAGDARSFLKRYFTSIDLSTPSKPQVADPINIPGEVIAVDGEEIITRDVVWDDTDLESLVARLSIGDGKARLLAQRLFDERQVENVTVDGIGRLLVSHAPAYHYREFAVPTMLPEEQTHKLSVLSAESLKVLGEADLDTWASLVSAASGRALYSVPGGVLLINVEDATKPVAQAYFPMEFYGAQHVVVDAERFVLAGGPYGLYTLSLDEANLLKP